MRLRLVNFIQNDDERTFPHIKHQPLKFRASIKLFCSKHPKVSHKPVETRVVRIVFPAVHISAPHTRFPFDFPQHKLGDEPIPCSRPSQKPSTRKLFLQHRRRKAEGKMLYLRVASRHTRRNLRFLKQVRINNEPSFPYHTHRVLPIN